MRPAILLTTCFLSGWAFPADAQVVVLGNGAATNCWSAAEFGTGTMSEGFDACSQALQQSISTRDKAATFTNRAVIRIRAGDYPGALNDASESILLMPNLGEAYVNRGAALLSLMRAPEALVAINRGIALGSGKMHLVYYNRATAKLLLGDIRGAYLDYKEAVALKPDFALATDKLSQFQVIRKASAPMTDGNASAGGDDDVMVALKTKPESLRAAQ